MQKKISFSEISPWTVLVRSSLICGFLAILIFGLSLSRIEPPTLSRDPLKFEAKNAYEQMKFLSKKFPGRVTWSENRAKAGDWIKQEFQKLGYTPKKLSFSEVIAGKEYTNLENIYAEKKGTTHPNEIIAVMAHYDITDTTIEGAMDDASGVGVVLELARVFAREKTDRTILFLLTDSEEFGAFWGATAFAHSFERADQIVAAINFDFVAPEKQTKVLTLCDGLKTGFTPLWLREMALDSLRSLGLVEVVDLDGMQEFVVRAMQIPPADHGAFLAAGIPAFNWVGQTDRFGYVMAHYHHTEHDVAEAMRVESFEPFGKGAERLIRSIDDLSRIPLGFRESSYWKISPRYFMGGVSATLLHILAFIPFLAYSLTRFGRVLRAHSRARIGRVIGQEVGVMAILLGSLLLGYVVILILPALRVITQYENFPATQKSVLLYTPNFLAILVVTVSIIGAYTFFKKIFSRPGGPEGPIEVRHAVHFAFLTIIIFLAFLKNSYLGVLLLLPPAYFWTMMSHRRGPGNRVLNGFLLLSGAVTFVALAVVLSTIFHVGVFYWYLFLSVAYGLISAYSVILFFMALTVMIRLFRSFVL